MRSRRGKRLAVGLLVGAAGLLAALDFHLLTTPVDITPALPPAGRGETTLPDAPEPATPLDKKAAEQFTETLRRPLFNPDRRPVQRNETAAAAEPRQAPVKLRLIGVMRLGSEVPRALLRFGDEPTGKWIAEGAEFKGWRLRRVKERSVVVEADQRTQELTLRAKVPPRPADPAPARATGGAGRD